MIDELGPGTVFGEIAMIAGERRSASVRAASPSTFVKINRSDFFDVLDKNETLREPVWRAFAERRFDDCVRDVGAFRSLRRAERVRLVKEAEHRVLAEREAVTQPAHDHRMLFLLLGSARLESATGSLVARAPMVYQGTGELRITPLSSARILWLPQPGTAHDRHGDGALRSISSMPVDPD